MAVAEPAWQPRAEERTATVEAAPVAALAAMFDDGLPCPGRLELLPPLWHWAALATWPPATRVGADGHARRGGLLPPVQAQRRMFAGGSVRVYDAPRVGAQVRVRREVTAVQHKQGRAGPLVVVTVASRVADLHGTPLLDEEQHLVFLDPPASSGQAAPRPVTPAGTAGLRRLGDGQWELATDAVLLLRFSAATANTHRIHYDLPYATKTEGYPGLVVHGPLLAVALLEVLRLERPGDAVRSVSFRARAPLFCGQVARLTHRVEGGSAQLMATHGGDTLLSADVAFT